MQNNSIFYDDISEIIISEKQIKQRIEELGKEITESYNENDDIVMLCILRGAVIFMADLAREINLSVTFDFMDVSSYGAGTQSSGVVRIIKDMEENIEGRHLLIVEDIIDTGLTLKHVVDMLKTRNPASIKVVTLLDKPKRREQKQIEADYNGFEIPDKFVVGYGLDFAEKYRNLPYIGVLKEKMYK
ncbi:MULTISPECIES: hypoxanthine phosphoribosyltransferase [unclassified Halanaerobium]|uniref:hypoxanthine phosphoribosyltransferase n=1 Tax=unclassified Halanaerobium TaxID=2641197 RepID=UPI000DF19528|nr:MULTISPECIES: hypoxanthine phosphoribosyltransferase [unclassified Halanaerobium]RCW41162.1 hypoxanthine phosphoribosyltransferase [Halanaerobium sp. MA284_MarDTE_T2]RCW79598.1 hypoxanthine phosphoribosyltransferase [Halanaerobium sp. DL-01]